jgi:regulatory protein
MPAVGGGNLPDFGQAYRKAADYCAAQDRCISEMKLKIRSWDIDSEFFDQIITQLIDEGFLDEKRFAENYARGKFRMKGWGKLKIAAGLRARSIPASLIQLALASIDQEEYALFLSSLLRKKLIQLGGSSVAEQQKAAYFAASRGFESGLIALHLHDSELFDL